MIRAGGAAEATAGRGTEFRSIGPHARIGFTRHSPAGPSNLRRHFPEVEPVSSGYRPAAAIAWLRQQ